MPILVPGAVVAEALSRFGVDPSTARPVPRGGAPDGLVLACRRAGQEAFCKIKPLDGGGAHERERARERDVVALAEHLLASGVPVVRYLPALDGDALAVVSGHVVCLTARAPGRHVSEAEALAPGFARTWAGTLGRIHAATLGWGGGDALWSWRDEHRDFATRCRDAEVGALWEDLGDRMSTLTTEPAGYGVVHNDLHHGNLLLAPDGDLTVLDLDVASWHWYATDLAILLVHPLWSLRNRPADARRFATTAAEAYLAEYPLPAGCLADVPLLAHYRMALFVLAMQDELGGRPCPAWLGELRSAVLHWRALPGLDTLA